MNLAEIETDVRDAITTIKTKAEEIIETHLPKLDQAAQDAENDPLIAAIEGVFLPPDVKQMLAELVIKLGTIKATDTAPEAASDPQPAEGDSGSPIPAPAGPQVAGVA